MELQKKRVLSIFQENASTSYLSTHQDVFGVKEDTIKLATARLTKLKKVDRKEVASVRVESQTNRI